MSGWIRLQYPVIVAGLLAMAGFLSVLFFYSPIEAKSTHLGGLACQDCHLAGESVSPKNARQLVDSQEQLCSTCHENALVVSHPSGFPANRDIPAEYPLDWKGDITCSTCHLVHGDGQALMRGEKSGRDLCLSCHASDFFDRMADQGVSIMQAGHIKQDSMPLMLDAYSVHCMSCHGDVVKTGGLGSKYADYAMAHGYSTMKHPIGMRYDENAGEKYRYIEELDERLVLPDGKLSCVTCHQAYGDGHGELVISNSGSALCFQCHAL